MESVLYLTKNMISGPWQYTSVHSCMYNVVLFSMSKFFVMKIFKYKFILVLLIKKILNLLQCFWIFVCLMEESKELPSFKGKSIRDIHFFGGGGG